MDIANMVVKSDMLYVNKYLSKIEFCFQCF